MNTSIMSKTSSHDSPSSSFSRRHLSFQWRKRVVGGDQQEDDDEQDALNLSNSDQHPTPPLTTSSTSRKKLTVATVVTVARLRSVLTNLANRRARSSSSSGLGTRVVGTLFGYRRGHVHLALQEDTKSIPALLIELATPINGLVREMASGLVRIALECDRSEEKRGLRLLQEPIWRTFCNGKKCGFAMRRECGAHELKVLKAVEPISMGAGVLPGNGGEEGELMYMRAKFERVVGSRDSEAFYMMNPDCNGGPELSIYLLRV